MKSKKPLLAFSSKRVLQRKLPNGNTGWVSRLRANYANFEEWEAQSDCWGLCFKLGYDDAKTAWKGNPIVCGSTTHAGDYGRYKRERT